MSMKKSICRITLAFMIVVCSIKSVVHPAQRRVAEEIGVDRGQRGQEARLRHPDLMRDGRLQELHEGVGGLVLVGDREDRAGAEHRLAEILFLVGGEVEEIGVLAHDRPLGEDF